MAQRKNLLKTLPNEYVTISELAIQSDEQSVCLELRG